MPSKRKGDPTGGHDAAKSENVVKKYPQTIDGCYYCPPDRTCEGPEITIETSGCLDGGGSFYPRGSVEQVIPLHVECPNNGKLTITTGESLNGGGEFTANQQCGTDIELEINNSWLDRFVMSRIGDGKLMVNGDFTIGGGGEFTANQMNDTNIVLTVNWQSMPIDPNSLLQWSNGMLTVDASDWEALRTEFIALQHRVAHLEDQVSAMSESSTETAARLTKLINSLN